MIIIEGADCTGKTTLAKEICERTGLLYKHMGPPEEYADFDHILWYDKNSKFPAVWDRFHLGEHTYGALRLSKRGSLDQQLVVRGLLGARGATVVILYSESDEWLRAKFLESKKAEMYSADQVLSINAMYRLLAHTGQWYDFAHDVSSGWPSRTLIEAVIATSRWQWRA